jgi:hypothetical protein
MCSSAWARRDRRRLTAARLNLRVTPAIDRAALVHDIQARAGAASTHVRRRLDRVA